MTLKKLLQFKYTKKFKLFHDTGTFVFPLKTSENLWYDQKIFCLKMLCVVTFPAKSNDHKNHAKLSISPAKSTNRSSNIGFTHLKKQSDCWNRWLSKTDFTKNLINNLKHYIQKSRIAWRFFYKIFKSGSFLYD